MSIVTIETGALEGVEREGVIAFLGIPFAAPPVGPLRWRPPQPVAPWSGVKCVDRYGPDPVQHPQTMHGAQPFSEDCLYLNVWAPAERPATPLPVMVFIYGGGFMVGSSSLSAYKGTRFAQRGVVLVNFNYRLGKLGFFAHPALTAEHPDEPTGNYGILDQIAALKWVQRNIGAFGGDPENVTIFGESAGGMSVHFLMSSSAARGLFHRAIAHSAPSRMPTATLEQSLEAGAQAAAEWGVTGDDAAALRQVPADTVLGQPGPPGRGGPMVDGKVIPEPTAAAFAAGRIAKVPYMLGTNSFETGFFPGMAKGTSERFAAKWGQASEFYDGFGTGETSLMEEEVFGDLMLTAPSRELARYAARAGLPTYLYYFSYLRPAQRGKVPGAIHVDEIYAVFGTMDALIDGEGVLEPNDPAETRAIVDAMQSRWVEFARSGAPDTPEIWPAYQLDDERLLDFAQDGPVLRKDFLKARLDFADSLAGG